MRRSTRSPPPPPPNTPTSYSSTNAYPPHLSSLASCLQTEKSKKKCCRRAITPPSKGNGSKSSMYRGVTRHRCTGRYEAHLWDKRCWIPVQNRKGKQVYLGAFDDEEAAAHTYDLAALKYWGPDTILNFPFHLYVKEYEEMKGMSREEYMAFLRRRSNGFSRGASKYRGVARHHHNGRWEARIGRIFDSKYIYLGTFETQEEAAHAYDLAAIEFKGLNAVTNFDINSYLKDQQEPNASFPHPHLQQSNVDDNDGYHPHLTLPPETVAAASSASLDLHIAAPPQVTYLVRNPIGLDLVRNQPWTLCMEPGFHPYLAPLATMDEPSHLDGMRGHACFEDNIGGLFKDPNKPHFTNAAGGGTGSSGEGTSGGYRGPKGGFPGLGGAGGGVAGVGSSSSSTSTANSGSYPFSFGFWSS